jgi:hypothetical protein
MMASGITGGVMMNVMRGGDLPRSAFYRIGAPLQDTYWVEVRTSTPDRLQIGATLEA